MTPAARILVVDDEPLAREALCELLAREHYQVESTGEGRAVEELNLEFRPDLILLDVRLPDTDGLTILRRFQELPEAPSFIVMTAYGSSESAIQAIKYGAFDYITKPVNFEELSVVVRRAIEYRRLTEQVAALRENYTAAVGLRNMVGNSPAMQAVYKMIGRVAPSEATVLIRGESGTGKELVAEALHAHSPRSQGPLIKINCAAIPETLLEAELFGYEKGAFTDARQQHLGRFEQASGGTIFLDEIAELSPGTQAKLLRVLQERTIERLGGQRTISVDVRILAATACDLEQSVRAGQFREDLYYRLNVIAITLPRLRDRREDLPELIEHLLRKHESRLGVPSPGLSPEALDLLVQYGWPGNVRQLENVLQRALVLARGRPITPELIQLESPLSGGAAALAAPQLDISKGFHGTVAEVEKQVIAQALRLADGNRTRAAALLKIQRRLLYAKMQEHGIADE